MIRLDADDMRDLDLPPDPPDEDPGDPGPEAPTIYGNPTYSRAPDGPRDRDLRVPVSDGERAEITRRAREAGVPVAEYMRRRALD